MPKKITEGKLEQRETIVRYLNLSIWILKSELVDQDIALLVRQMKNVDSPEKCVEDSAEKI